MPDISQQDMDRLRQAFARFDENAVSTADFVGAAYAKQDEELEARQLLVLRSSAQAGGNYALAVQLNSYISDRLATDSTVAALYRNQGVTSLGLAQDAKYLEAMAAQQATAAAASEEIQPDQPQPERP